MYVLTSNERRNIMSMAEDLKHVQVTSEEIAKYDPMIRRLAYTQLLKYWAHGIKVDDQNCNISIGRFGMGLEDLMQFGRLQVLNQLRWYKTYGRKTGKKTAKETTMVYNHLSNKFQSLSKTYSNAKHGGQVVSVKEQKKLLDLFVCKVREKPEMALAEADGLLVALLEECNKEVQKIVRRGLYRKGKFVSKIQAASDIAKHVEKRASELVVVSHTSLESYSVNNNLNDSAKMLLDYSPEDFLLAKEALQQRLDKKRKKKVPCFRIMNLAKTKGLRTQQAVANMLGIAPTTLSNILCGRSKGSAPVREKLLNAFGEDIESLRRIEEGR
jgi:hypothetical protein